MVNYAKGGSYIRVVLHFSLSVIINKQHNGLCNLVKQSEITMELDGCVQVSLGGKIIIGKLSQNSLVSTDILG